MENPQNPKTQQTPQDGVQVAQLSMSAEKRVGLFEGETRPVVDGKEDVQDGEKLAKMLLFVWADSNPDDSLNGEKHKSHSGEE